jgi:pimeloyl-ACP methyl ester carboxylesterase
MTTFVLVPGAWLGAWAWDDVTDRLHKAGHTVHPVTLTGLAERSDQGGPGVDLDTHIADITGLLDAEDLQDVVLAGHSYAGIVVTGVADRRPDRVARVVYVDSGPAPDGVSSSEFGPPEARAETARQVAEQGEGWRLAPSPFDPADDPANLAGLDEPTLAMMRARATDHPYASMTQPLSLTGAGDRVPRTAICCTFPLDAVRAMIDSGNPFFAGLRDATLVALPTGHWPMFSEPDALATALIAAADAP